MVSRVRILVFLLLVLLVLLGLYVYGSRQVVEKIEILQSRYDDYDPDILLQKQPLVLVSGPLEAETVLRRIFPWSFWRVQEFKESMEDQDQHLQYRGRFLLLGATEPTSLTIEHPTIETDIHILLKPGTWLILPAKWWVVPTPALITYQIDDIVTRVISI